MTPAIYINCKEEPFIRQIMAIQKLVETRTRNVLGKFHDMRVYLVESGKGQSMVVGSVCIGESYAVTEKRVWDSLRSITQVPEGSRYDWKPFTRKKWLTPLLRPMMCEPWPLPKDAVRHGRTWVEITGEGKDFNPSITADSFR